MIRVFLERVLRRDRWCGSSVVLVLATLAGCGGVEPHAMVRPVGGGLEVCASNAVCMNLRNRAEACAELGSGMLRIANLVAPSDDYMLGMRAEVAVVASGRTVSSVTMFHFRTAVLSGGSFEILSCSSCVLRQAYAGSVVVIPGESVEAAVTVDRVREAVCLGSFSATASTASD